jgi:hypothetical protein
LMERVRERWQKRVPTSHALPSPPLKGEGAGGFMIGRLKFDWDFAARTMKGTQNAQAAAERRRYFPLPIRANLGH